MGSAFLAVLLVLTLQPVVIGPPAPQPSPEQRCEDQPSPDGEMVVCGERYDENSPYRVPQEFRGLRSDDDRHASWDARWRDQQEVMRYGDQTVGPFGYLQRGRQMYCEWLAERQMAQGRRPDCGRKPRPDSEDDWRRR